MIYFGYLIFYCIASVFWISFSPFILHVNRPVRDLSIGATLHFSVFSDLQLHSNGAYRIAISVFFGKGQH